MSAAVAGGPKRAYKAFPGWLCIDGSRVRRYIRNFYRKIVLTDEMEMVGGTVTPEELEAFREHPTRETA